MGSESGTGKDISHRRGSWERQFARHRACRPIFAEFVQNLARSLFDPYRPEQHYMRGPGPKWHAKHDRASVATGDTRAGPGAREALILGPRA